MSDAPPAPSNPPSSVAAPHPIRRRTDIVTANDGDASIASWEGDWDVERVLETMVAILTLASVVLGLMSDRRWLILPGIVATFLLPHLLGGRARHDGPTASDEA